MGRKRRWKYVEEEEEAKEVIIISDDEDDANADLSIAILAKASRKHSLLSGVVLLDEDESPQISTPSAPSPAPLSSTLVPELVAAQQLLSDKKQKRKIKKKQIKAPETVAEQNQAGNAKESTLIKIVGDNEEDNLELRQLLRGPRYFDPQDTLCFRCGNTGHFAGNCTEDVRKKACFVCGSLDHEVKDCPQSCCLICQGIGHFSKACPQKGTQFNRLRERSNFCLRCGNTGHEMSSCDKEYELQDLQRIQCYVCRKYGHLCCVDVALTSERQDTCYNCGDIGHTGVGCVKSRGNLERDLKSESVCYRCGEMGHFARGCRKRNEDDSWDDFGTPGMGVQLSTDGFQGFLSVPAIVGARKHRHKSEFHDRSVNTSPVRWPERWSMDDGRQWRGSVWKHKHHQSKGYKHLDDDAEYNTPSRKWGRQTPNKNSMHTKAHGHVEARKSYSCGKRFWRKQQYY